MLNLKLKNSVLKRYYIFDWYWEWFFGGFPQKCILCFPQIYWEVLLHWTVFSCREVFCKTTVEFSTKILKGVLQKHSSPSTQDVNWTYIRRSEDVLDVFWTSYVRSVYVLCLLGYVVYENSRRVLQKYWELFY